MIACDVCKKSLAKGIVFEVTHRLRKDDGTPPVEIRTMHACCVEHHCIALVELAREAARMTTLPIDNHLEAAGLTFDAPALRRER